MASTATAALTVHVQIDGLVGTFPATLYPGRWNGWVLPAFDEATALAVCADFNAANDCALPGDPDVETLQMTSTRDAVELRDHRGTVLDRWDRDDAGRFGIGAFGWCWSLAPATPAPATPTTDPDALPLALDAFAAAFSDPYLAADLASKLTCTEFDALAGLLQALGQHDAHRAWLDHHAAADDSGDAHYVPTIDPEHDDHDALPDDAPEPGDRCRTCAAAITWLGPSHLDWAHVGTV